MDIWTDRKIEELRDSRRKRGRIAFDCFNLKMRDDRAYCARGHRLGWSEEGTFCLSSILKGITPTVCKKCKEFDSMEEERKEEDE